jgi:protein involved in polysaccharide export with SLBB domain
MNTHLGITTRLSRLCKIVAMVGLLTLGVGDHLTAQSGPEQSKAVQLSALEIKLNELLAQFTEFNPEVVRLRKQIQRLKEEQLSPIAKNPDGASAEKVSSQEPAAALAMQTNDPRAFPAAATALPVVASAARVALTAANTPAEISPGISGLPPETANPAKAQPKKEPVFSPLPSDLLPTNATSKGNPSSALMAGANNSMETLDDKHRLAIGDKLSFRIVEDEEDPKPMIVTDSGELEVPYLGRFLAVGKSCKQLAHALKAELEKDYYYKATVIIAVDQMTKSRGNVYLVGAVRSPGPQPIPSDEVLTVSKAILRAGSFTDFADKKAVKVTRKPAAGGEDQTYTVNVEVILEKGKSEADLALIPGDLIYVSERVIRF